MSKMRKVLIWFLCIFLLSVAAMGVYGYKIYYDVTKTTDKMYKKVDIEKKRKQPLNIEQKEPFSILLLGIDTDDEGTEQGRSDSLMLMTVNPEKDETKMVSIPRDTYTEIVGHGTTDKINHAYAFGGTEMSLNTVQNLLDIPIDYYIEINMKGIKEIVDAVGGVDVNSPLEFSYKNIRFTKGPIHLNGEKTLAYSRMRYEDPNGDYGRQGRQRQVLEAIVKKAANFSTLTKYKDILDAMGNYMATNLTFDEMINIQRKYKEAAGNIEQIQMQGTGEMIDGISYQIVSPEELQKISGKLKVQLGL